MVVVSPLAMSRPSLTMSLVCKKCPMLIRIFCRSHDNRSPLGTVLHKTNFPTGPSRSRHRHFLSPGLSDTISHAITSSV